MSDSAILWTAEKTWSSVHAKVTSDPRNHTLTVSLFLHCVITVSISFPWGVGISYSCLFCVWVHLLLFKIMSFLCGSVSKVSSCNSGNPDFILESGRSLGEENNNPLQYSCLGNPMDRGIWWVTVHDVTKVRRDIGTETRPFLIWSNSGWSWPFSLSLSFFSVAFLLFFGFVFWSLFDKPVGHILLLFLIPIPKIKFTCYKPSTFYKNLPLSSFGLCLRTFCHICIYFIVIFFLHQNVRP